MIKGALRGLFTLLLLALVGCDHATKVAAKAALEGARPFALVPGLLDLQYTENRDTAFSLSRGFDHPSKGWLLLGTALLVLVAVSVAWWKRRRGASALEHVAFVLVVSGALGNVVDRIARGYVIDFIHVTRWPVFNVADVAITLGAVLIGWTAIRRGGLTGDRASAR